MKWDLFISYASEDRARVVEPLVEALRSLGLSAWYDKTELKVGDRLTWTIDEGLAHSRYGVVVLSPNFFGKRFPERELAGLTQREIAGEDVILPIWVDVTDKEVREYSLPLGERVAAQWSEGLQEVAWKIFEKVRHELIENAMEQAATIPRTKLSELQSGKQIVDLLTGIHWYAFGHDEPENEHEVDLVSGFLQSIKDYGEILDDLEIGDQVTAGYELNDMLSQLHESGWKLFGGRSSLRIRVGEEVLSEPVPTFLGVVARSGAEGISWFRGNRFLVYRPPPEDKATEEVGNE